MLFLLYVNLMCCTAFVVLVCRVVTCMDSSAHDGFEQSAGEFPWKEARGGPHYNRYEAIPSPLAEYHPGPNSQLSPAGARRQWNAIHNLYMEAAEPAVAGGSSGPGGQRRRLTTADDIANGILYASQQDPIARWMRRNEPQDTQEERAASDGNYADGVPDRGEAPQTPFAGSRRRAPKRHFLVRPSQLHYNRNARVT